MILGAHQSIAGGVHRALELASAHGLAATAMFVRNQRRWAAPPLSEQEALLFHGTRRRLGIAPVVAHGSYLLNLAAVGDLRDKSIVAMRDEYERCTRLGIDYLVIHPGSSPEPRRGMRRIAEALNGVVAEARGGNTIILLESTAGAGNSVGGTFEQLAAMLDLLRPTGRFGICMDTCHVFAAGYDIRTPQAYKRTMADFDRIVGIGHLLALHVNDSVKGLGSHVDRHAHIGKGKIGLEGMANFVNDPRLEKLPFILETPKEKSADGRDMDVVNAEAIRGLERTGR